MTIFAQKQFSFSFCFTHKVDLSGTFVVTYAFACFSAIGEETRLARIVADVAKRDQPTRQQGKFRASEVETIQSLADVQAVLGQLFSGIDVSRDGKMPADGNTDNASADDVSVDGRTSSDIFTDDTSSTDTVGWFLTMLYIVLCKLTALQINCRSGNPMLKGGAVVRITCILTISRLMPVLSVDPYRSLSRLSYMSYTNLTLRTAVGEGGGEWLVRVLEMFEQVTVEV